MPNNKIHRIAITAGEPAGIGPDLVIQLAQHDQANELIVIADPALLNTRAELLKLPITLETIDTSAPATPTKAGVLKILPIDLATPCIPGQLNNSNARYVLNTLTQAIKGCRDKVFSAMVTGPVHKGVINDAGIPFTGHTEFLAEQTNTPLVVMMLATEGLRVALATTHLPLANVPKAITAESLEKIITILYHDLQKKFGLSQPTILVCGLNPHAGENGHLGREEIDIIIPVLEKLRANQWNLIGPLSADTLFSPKNLDSADAVLAMYHDQGLPVLKYKGFGNAVNITLGLPIIRTSVDHGTALDLAGTGQASHTSFMAAIAMAAKMSTSQSNH